MSPKTRQENIRTDTVWLQPLIPSTKATAYGFINLMQLIITRNGAKKLKIVQLWRVTEITSVYFGLSKKHKCSPMIKHVPLPLSYMDCERSARHTLVPNSWSAPGGRLSGSVRTPAAAPAPRGWGRWTDPGKISGRELYPENFSGTF